MTTALLLALALTGGPQHLSTEPFTRCAQRTIRGDWPAKDWQLAAYRAGLDAGVTADRMLLVTAYHAGEGVSGRIDRYGNRCTMRTCASNRLPRRSYVWTRFGVRQVLDCGAKSNSRRAERRGCDAWLDVWYPNARAARAAGCDTWTPTRGAVIPL